MIAAGWNPLVEQAKAFLTRTGFVPEKLWPIEPTPNPQIKWPSLNLKAAA